MRRRICSCGLVVTVGTTCVCRAKAKRLAEAARPSARERGYTTKWQGARAEYLAAHSLCSCGRPATVVDHITPHKGDQKLFWDRKNWQPQCHPCHSRKTAKYDGGFGRAVSRGGV